MTERSCEGCNVCCKALAVPALDKPAGQACAHMVTDPNEKRRGACRIYATRPAECQAYRCLWLSGFGPTRHRPDRSGLVLEGQVTAMGPAVVVREVRTGALAGVWGGQVLRELRRTGANLYIKRQDGSVSVQGDEAFVRKAAEIAASAKANGVHLKITNG